LTIYNDKAFLIVEFEELEKHYYVLYNYDLGAHFLYEIEIDDVSKFISTPTLVQDNPEQTDIASGDNAADIAESDISIQTYQATIEWQVFQLINHERTSRGRPALQMDNKLRDLARSHSKDMGDNNFFSHTSPTTGTFGNRLSVWSISYLNAAENIAWNTYPSSQTAQVAVTGWMNSTGHRNNILNGVLKYTGIGVYRTSSGRYYHTQVFTNSSSPPSRIINPPSSSTPPRVTLSSPANGANVGGTSVQFRWNAATGATKYQLQIRRVNDNSIFRNTILGNVTTRNQSGFLNNGVQYKWRVRAGNAAGWGPWSVFRNLTNKKDVVVSGFNTNLNSANGWQGWIRRPRAVWSLNNRAMITAGQTNKWVNARYRNNIYTNLDYSVRMRRVNSSNAAQYLIVRAGNSYLANGYWNPGYAFGYHNNGRYSIWRRNADGSVTQIQGWTASSAINKNGWNILRVRAVGNNFRFYINGTLVRTFTNTSLRQGRVGVTMYRSPNDPANTRLNVDWARLTVISSTTLSTDTVSPEQEALNKAVMDSGVEGSPEYDDQTGIPREQIIIIDNPLR
jgi:uncharacterized protein YkwD